MTIIGRPSAAGGGGGSAAGGPHGVIELIVGRGLDVDVFGHISTRLDSLTADARAGMASIDTYLRFADACGRLDLTRARHPVGLPPTKAERPARGALTGAGRAIAGAVHSIVTADGRG